MCWGGINCLYIHVESITQARLLAADVEGHEAALAAARAEYERLAERNAQEMVAWKAQVRCDGAMVMVLW